MTPEEFAKVYESSYDKAVAVATKAAGGRGDIGGEAVQEAALYCMERIEEQPLTSITASYFIQAAVSRAKNAVQPRGVRHGSGSLPVETPVGAAYDLERLELALEVTKSGRVLPKATDSNDHEKLR